MLTRSFDQPDRSVESLLMWALRDGTRCILAVGGHILELRTERNGVLLCRAYPVDARMACEVADAWRLAHEQGTTFIEPWKSVCPACGAVAFLDAGERGADNRRLRCGSCGEAWNVNRETGLRDLA